MEALRFLLCAEVAAVAPVCAGRVARGRGGGWRWDGGCCGRRARRRRRSRDGGGARAVEVAVGLGVEVEVELTAAAVVAGAVALDVEEAARVTRLALAIKQSMNTGQKVAV